MCLVFEYYREEKEQDSKVPHVVWHNDKYKVFKKLGTIGSRRKHTHTHNVLCTCYAQRNCTIFFATYCLVYSSWQK